MKGMIKMFKTRLVDIINETLKDESENKYGYEYIACDLSDEDYELEALEELFNL
jgi:hypothetical protein